MEGANKDPAAPAPSPPAATDAPHALSFATLAAAATSGIVIAQQVAGKAIRDAFYLSNFHVNTLPRVMVAAALVSLLCVLGVSKLLSTWSPRRVLPWLFLASAIGLFLEWMLSLAAPRPGAAIVYMHNAVVSPLLISTFWSHINEQYDPYTAKRAVARIAGGGTIGGLFGGLLTWRIVPRRQPALRRSRPRDSQSAVRGGRAPLARKRRPCQIRSRDAHARGVGRDGWRAAKALSVCAISEKSGIAGCRRRRDLVTTRLCVHRASDGYLWQRPIAARVLLSLRLGRERGLPRGAISFWPHRDPQN